jgi:hypothetical protein
LALRQSRFVADRMRALEWPELVTIVADGDVRHPTPGSARASDRAERLWLTVRSLLAVHSAGSAL